MDEQSLESMVERVSWFVGADYEILRWFTQHDLEVDSSYGPVIVTPTTMADMIDKHPEYIGRRMRLLRDGGILDQIGEGRYQLSDFGRDFLAGEAGHNEIEAHNPNE